MTLPPNTEKLLLHPKALCNMVRRVAIEAGDAIMDYYDESGCAADQKEDGSPQTEGDRAAEKIIIARLFEITPGIPVIGEESVAAGLIPDLTQVEWFWLVDPLDGTKEFIKGSPDFTVNIALIHKGVPVLGVIYAPVGEELYAGHGPGTAIRWLAEHDKDKPIKVRDMPAKGITLISSRNSHNEAALTRFLQDFKVAKAIRRGSSLKMCMIAAGKADIYPRFGLTSEWDTAAGDAILRSAGGHIVDMNGDPLSYGHADRKFLNPEFVASSGFWPVPDVV